MIEVQGSQWRQALAAGLNGFNLVARYKWTKYGYRDGGYAQLKESEYSV